MDEEMLQKGEPYVKDPDENWFINPSVAGYEYPEDGLNWRIGLMREVIDSDEALQAVAEILNTPFTEKLTRNMARLVVSEKFIRSRTPTLMELADCIESVISLKESGNPNLVDCYQLVFARNASSRQSSPEAVEKEIKAVNEAFARGKSKFTMPPEVPQQENITFTVLTPDTDNSIVEQYKRLILSGFAEEDVNDALTREQTLNVVAILGSGSNASVVGGVYAVEDTQVLRRNNRNFKFISYEIAGAKISPELRNRGLYTSLSANLYRSLAARPVDLVFGYSNAEEPAVFAVAGRMGRSIVTETASELGLSFKPAIQQTITEGKLVDEIVTYLPGDRLRSLYG